MQQTTYFYLAAKGKHFLLSKLNERLKLLNRLNNLSSWHLFLSLHLFCAPELSLLPKARHQIFFFSFLSLPGFSPQTLIKWQTLSWHPSLKPLESWNPWFRIQAAISTRTFEPLVFLLNSAFVYLILKRSNQSLCGRLLIGVLHLEVGTLHQKYTFERQGVDCGIGSCFHVGAGYL